MEIYSNNAFYTAKYYQNALGFDIIGIRNSYTHKHTKTNEYLIKNGDIHIKICSPNYPNNKEISSFLSIHGDTLKSVNIEVDSLQEL